MSKESLAHQPDTFDSILNELFPNGEDWDEGPLREDPEPWEVSSSTEDDESTKTTASGQETILIDDFDQAKKTPGRTSQKRDILWLREHNKVYPFGETPKDREREKYSDQLVRESG